ATLSSHTAALVQCSDGVAALGWHVHHTASHTSRTERAPAHTAHAAGRAPSHAAAGAEAGTKFDGRGYARRLERIIADRRDQVAHVVDAHFEDFVVFGILSANLRDAKSREEHRTKCGRCHASLALRKLIHHRSPSKFETIVANFHSAWPRTPRQRG